MHNDEIYCQSFDYIDYIKTFDALLKKMKYVFHMSYEIDDNNMFFSIEEEIRIE